MNQLMISRGRCQFCHRTSEDVRVLVGGDSSSICDDCIASAARAIAPGERTDAPVAPAEPERYLVQRLTRHFAPLRPEDMVATSRTYPARQQADLQLALDELLGERRVPESFVGILQQYRHEQLGYSKLVEQGRNAIPAAPAQYEEVDIGRGETVRCLKNGVWFLREAGTPYVAVLSQFDDYRGGTSIALEIAAPSGDAGLALSTRVFDALERRLSKASCYRGRVLSLESAYAYAGFAQRIRVHDMEPVAREDVILPDAVLDVLERNVLRFAEQRESLRKLGLSTQKGLLFYGPPGTGKTHSIRYLAGRLQGHTTLLITAEEMGILPEYMALARLLQPTLVVIEDADLVARDRGERADACDEVLLNRLLNELDGLRERADLFFILTTNRPETLEPALASRPGRIDQAVAFPLPDEACRRRLSTLYAKGLAVPAALLDDIARRTDGASPAFIKELMRRIAQQHFDEGGIDVAVSQTTVEQALHEMLFAGGVLNKRLLGGEVVTG